MPSSLRSVQKTHKTLPQNASFFLVDPIDGTKEFINKRDEFTLNIALIENGEPVFGAVCVPAKSTMYIGSQDQGSFEYDLDLESAGLSQPRKIYPGEPDNKALNIVASRSHLCQQTRDFIDANQVGNLVNAGSSLKFCLVACGKADLYPRFGPTMEWDTAAGHAVLKAAGGIVVDLQEKPLQYGKKGLTNGVFLAYNKAVEFKFS